MEFCIHRHSMLFTSSIAYDTTWRNRKITHHFNWLSIYISCVLVLQQLWWNAELSVCTVYVHMFVALFLHTHTNTSIIVKSLLNNFCFISLTTLNMSIQIIRGMWTDFIFVVQKKFISFVTRSLYEKIKSIKLGEKLSAHLKQWRSGQSFMLIRSFIMLHPVSDEWMRIQSRRKKCSLINGMVFLTWSVIFADKYLTFKLSAANTSLYKIISM